MAETAVGYSEEEVSPHHSAGIDQPEAASILLLQAGLLEAAGGREWGVEGQRKLSVLREGSQTGNDWSI